MEPTTLTSQPDVQASAPTVRVSLSRVGVTGVEKVIRIGAGDGHPQLFSARLECFVDLGPKQKGAHMSRFEEVVNDVIGEVILGETGFKAEQLAQRIAERVRERQDALRAEVTIAARFPERRPAPVSGTPTQEISTLHAAALASERGTRRMVGVSAQGITTAPRAQRVLAADARERLAAEGFSDAEIAQVLDRVPVATHDQRGTGTLKLECPEDCAFVFDVPALLAIVEGAMSSEIFELMKRSDEGAVVERAHRRPRTPADCVAAMIAGAVERFAELPDAAVVSARQESFETVHRHCVTAERTDRLGALRGELKGTR